MADQTIHRKVSHVTDRHRACIDEFFTRIFYDKKLEKTLPNFQPNQDNGGLKPTIQNCSFWGEVVKNYNLTCSGQNEAVEMQFRAFIWMKIDKKPCSFFLGHWEGFPATFSIRFFNMIQQKLLNRKFRLQWLSFILLLMVKHAFSSRNVIK